MNWHIAAVVTALVLGVVMAGSLLWLAAESHYRACIERVEANFPATKQVQPGLFSGNNAPYKDVPNPQRPPRVANCSRLPF
jgi:hypothetical protein